MLSVKENAALFRDLPESFKVGQPLPAHSLTRLRHPLPSDGRGTQLQSGGAAAPPYHKSKTVGLTCRSAQILGTRNASLPKTNRRTSSLSRPASRFVRSCELLAT